MLSEKTHDINALSHYFLAYPSGIEVMLHENACANSTFKKINFWL